MGDSNDQEILVEIRNAAETLETLLMEARDVGLTVAVKMPLASKIAGEGVRISAIREYSA